MTLLTRWKTCSWTTPLWRNSSRADPAFRRPFRPFIVIKTTLGLACGFLKSCSTCVAFRWFQPVAWRRLARSLPHGRLWRLTLLARQSSRLLHYLTKSLSNSNPIIRHHALTISDRPILLADGARSILVGHGDLHSSARFPFRKVQRRKHLARKGSYEL